MQALPIIDYEAHPRYAGFRRNASELRERAMSMLGPLLEEKQRVVVEADSIFEERGPSSSHPVSGELARVGAVGLQVAPKVLDRVRRAIGPFDSELETRVRNKRAKGRSLKFRDVETLLWSDGRPGPHAEKPVQALRWLLDHASVLDLAHAYYPSRQFKLHRLVLRRNVEGQDFYSGGVDDPPTIGMHIDSSARPAFNGVVYLNRVGPDQGAFRYVEGSNHWSWDSADRAVRKAVDEAGFDFRGDDLFFNLPPELRRRANFGYDVRDGTVESEFLLSREKVFCSEECDMVVFDSEGVHRGGRVQEGHRSALLFVLKVT